MEVTSSEVLKILKIAWFDLMGLRLTPVTPGLFQSHSWSSSLLTGWTSLCLVEPHGFQDPKQVRSLAKTVEAPCQSIINECWL